MAKKSDFWQICTYSIFVQPQKTNPSEMILSGGDLYTYVRTRLTRNLKASSVVWSVRIVKYYNFRRRSNSHLKC